MTSQRYPDGTLLAFTRQDLVTFAVGLGVALAVTLGEALVNADTVEDWTTWARNLGIGFATAAGRYMLTEISQRGLRGGGDGDPEPVAELLEQNNLMRTAEPLESTSVIKP
jgi:hypothetical protein